MSSKAQIGRVAAYRHREDQQHWYHACADCGVELREADTDANIAFLKEHRDCLVLQQRLAGDGTDLDAGDPQTRDRAAEMLEGMGELFERDVLFERCLWDFALPARHVLIYIGDKTGPHTRARHWIEQHMDWAVLRLPDHEIADERHGRRSIRRAISRAARKMRASA